MHRNQHSTLIPAADRAAWARHGRSPTRATQRGGRFGSDAPQQGVNEYEPPQERQSLGADVGAVALSLVASGRYDGIKAGVARFQERFPATWSSSSATRNPINSVSHRQSHVALRGRRERAPKVRPSQDRKAASRIGWRPTDDSDWPSRRLKQAIGLMMTSCKSSEAGACGEDRQRNC